MTDQPSDPLAPIRAKAPFSMVTIVVYGCTMDIVADKRGTLFPFEVIAEHGEQHYAQNVADLRALAAALNLALAVDTEIARLEADIAALRGRVELLERLLRAGLSLGSWDDFAAWKRASDQWHKNVAGALQDSQEEHRG